MRRTILSISMCAAVVLLVSNVTNAVLFDNFEDGDTTNNPTWDVTNALGTHSITEDPFRIDNLVLQATGTISAHRALNTQANILTDGFYFEAEYAASSSADKFNLILGLNGQSDFILRTQIAISATDGYTNWRLAQNPHNGPEWGEQDPDFPQIPSQPIGEWWKIILWNQPSTEIVNGEIRRLSDNSLIWSRTVSFPSISDLCNSAITIVNKSGLSCAQHHSNN